MEGSCLPLDAYFSALQHSLFRDDGHIILAVRCVLDCGLAASIAICCASRSSDALAIHRQTGGGLRTTFENVQEVVHPAH
jgi:hypothetical protein